MKSRSLLIALSLLATAHIGSAQSTAQSPVRGAQTAPDTLITLTEDELVAGLRAIAEAYRTKETPQRQSELTAEQLRLLKFQMLLNALGLGALPQGPAFVHPQVQPIHPQPTAHPQHNPQRYPQYPEAYYYRQYEPQSRTTLSQGSEATDARLDRLEQILLLLLQSRSNDSRTTTTVLPSRSSKSGRTIERTTIVQGQRNDSLLYRLQQELASLRASITEAQAMAQQPPAQPQQTPAQPQQAPAEAVNALPQITPTITVTPLTPLTPAQPIVRTDTIVEIVEQPENPNMLQRWQVFFGVGQSKLSAESQQTLDRAIQALNYRTTTKVTLTGYASPEGNADRNDLLSLRRSRAVRTYLVNHGITPDRIESVAGGVDHQADERVSARRVDVVLREK
ncbi:OmpA family protein [uncultured Porphyromonas sp.]|jgi:ompA family protein|uniref:OmpA family protein n=1 Tax=uncultured Porphyromonas sp. TaxID=159274 RepID=UPI0026035567|nr:OmpA family protein [uncultured Porphyromonas sp.]